MQNYFSQAWFPTVQDVLHADWHEVWHSPHPPFFALFGKFFVFNVLICFMVILPSSLQICFIISHDIIFVKQKFISRYIITASLILPIFGD